MTPDAPTGYPVLSGETLVVPILGDPIAQVKSPDGVTRALVARGRDAVVVPMHVLRDDLDTVVRGLGPVRSVAGLIATVPHKFGLAAHCATLTDRAAFLGSVNVARRNPDGTWHGDQVDGAAFVAACRANGAKHRGSAGPAGRRRGSRLGDRAGPARRRRRRTDPARRRPRPARRTGRPAARPVRRPVTTGPARSRRVRDRRQRHPHGHARGRPAAGRRRGPQARHVRRRRHHQARRLAADRGRPPHRVRHLDGRRHVRRRRPG